ncbi:hypothetical protein DLM77_19785 [Leptospira yasudae]|uniref:Uncharacterized protein n=1 Tax=Leptospira yasudae TaxID=2202201 RepID=A0ABX9LYI9_9LEPT|nr:hypothetical protein DLM77_19785 [Leptospira yasudae]
MSSFGKVSAGVPSKPFPWRQGLPRKRIHSRFPGSFFLAVIRSIRFSFLRCSVCFQGANSSGCSRKI